jgi:hypothetical protein
VALASPEDLDRSDLDALMVAALGLAAVPIGTADGPELIIRSVSAKQRPRR